MGGKADKKTVKATVTVRADEDRADPARGRPPDDWTYHGVGQRISPDGRAHILVEGTMFGLTEHERVAASRELDEPVHGGFYWGCNGGGPARAATAILADALNPGGPVPSGLDPTAATQDATLGALRSDFCWDVLSQLCEEWRLRRDAVLRWVRGWYTEHGLTDLPQAAAQLAPANPTAASRGHPGYEARVVRRAPARRMTGPVADTGGAVSGGRRRCMRRARPRPRTRC